MDLKYLFAKLISRLQIPTIKDCRIDKTAVVYERCELTCVTIGRYSYIAKNDVVSHTEIGNFCSIGGHSQIGGGMHPIEMVSSSSTFVEGRSAVGYKFGEIPYVPYKPVRIGNDVWVGVGSYIKGGVTIGNGAVVGAHSVVTHDVAPYSIVAGSPAREIRKRFDEETIRRLEELRWWDWPDDKIRKYAPYFESPEKLFTKIQEDGEA